MIERKKIENNKEDNGSYIDLKNLQQYLETGREIEFFFQKTKYYIANNSKGYVLLEVLPDSDTDSIDISEYFSDTNEFINTVKITNIPLKEIFSKYTKNLKIVTIF